MEFSGQSSYNLGIDDVMESGLNRVVSVRKKNITFVEVMLSTAVIAILAAIVIPFFTRANQKGQYAKWKTYKNKIQLDPALVTYFDFSDKEGKILTNSVRKASPDTYDAIDQDGRIFNAAGWKQGRWRLKWGLEFNGESSYILSSGDFSGTSTSVVIWFKSRASDAGLMSFTEKRDLDSSSWRNIFLKSGHVMCATPKGAVKSTVKLNDNKWHMVAVTMGTKSGKHILYVDGKEVSSINDFEVAGDKIKSLIVGYCNNAPFYKGSIDEVAVFQRELTSAEVEEFYKAGKP